MVLERAYYGDKMNSREVVDFLCRTLKGVKGSGGEWSARCPAHDDHRASLTFGRGATRKILLHCKARCSFAATATACGLSAEMRRHVVDVECIYLYRDADGKRSRELLRLPGKVFWQRSWDVSGAVIWSVKGVPRLLYDLPEVLASAERGGVIFVVEGERDVDTMKKRGLVATTAPSGASVEWTLDLVEPLRGAKRVLIVADCDDSGRRAAWQRHKAISKIVGDVRVIDFDPNRSDGYDVTDWLNDGGTLEGLQLLADATVDQVAPVFATSMVEASTREPLFLKIDYDVLKRRDLTNGEKTVYSFIKRDAEMAQQPKYLGKRLDLSTRAIANASVMARSTAQSAIKGLEAKGLIVTQRTNGGRCKRNSHEVLPPPPPPQMDRKSGHLTGTEMAEALLLNGPQIGPDMARKSVTQYNRVAETLSTQKENDSTIFDLENEPTAEKKFRKKFARATWLLARVAVDRRPSRVAVLGLRSAAGCAGDTADGGGNCRFSNTSHVGCGTVVAGRMEMTELPSAVDLSPLAEAVATALIARQGNHPVCEVPRRKLADELGITGARLTVAFSELEQAGWLTISRRAGYPSSFDVAPVLRSLLADKARAHRDAFPVSVIARLRTADVSDAVEAWLQEHDLGDAPVVYAAARLLAP